MGVYIKGMEMPKRCNECKVWSMCWNGLPAYNMCKSVCPLTELPPHGRLIDADELNIHDVVPPAYKFCVMGVTKEDIELAETVIEAEGET